MATKQEILDNHARFEQGLTLIGQLLDTGASEAAAQLAHETATFAWLNSCGIFVSARLEKELARLGKQLSAHAQLVLRPRSSGQRHVLTVMSSVHETGGHSRLAWRTLQLDRHSRHTLVLTQQNGLPLPAQIRQLHKQGRLNIVELTQQGLCERILALRDLVASADRVLLLTHPNDILPCAALPALDAPPPVIFLDHAAHTFWLGATISRLVLSMSAVMLESRRGIARDHIGWLPLPMDFEQFEQPSTLDIRRQLGISEAQPLLLSCGAGYKYWPIDGINLARLIEPVLQRHADAHLLVVGVSPTPFWTALQKACPGRVHLMGHLKEAALLDCYRACDIYLDPVPMTSPTAMFEAAALGKAVVRFAAPDWRKCEFSLEIDTIPTALYLWSTAAQYERDLDRLLSDAEFRRWRGEFGRQAVRLYHSERAFVEALESAYARSGDLPTISIHPDKSGWQYGRLDDLLHQLAVNMQRDRELDTQQSSIAPLSWQDPAPSIPPTLLQMLIQQGARIRLHVIIANGPQDRLERTQASLHQQTRPADRVIVACGTLADAWPDESEHEAWVLLLSAGDILPADAFARLASALQRLDAEATIAYFDHAESDGSATPSNPQFKPAVNPDLLLSMPYVGRALVVRADWGRVQQPIASARSCGLPLAYALALAALRERGKTALHGIPDLLAYLDPAEPTLYASTSEQWQALAQVLQQHLMRANPEARIHEGPAPGTFHVIYPLRQTPLVSIIIPTRDQLPLLSRCVESLLEKTSYPNFEVLIVDNDSQTPQARSYLQGLAELATDRIRVLAAPGPFNFSRMNNMAAQVARGEFLLLLNNDTAILQSDWLEHMVRHGLREDVGVVGARLLFPDGRLQHAGVIMGLRGPADHPLLGQDPKAPGYMCRAQLQQNFSAVTAACMLVRRDLYLSLGGLDETHFGVSYNDVDFCLRVGQTGKLIVWTPLATLLHEGSASQRAAVESASVIQKQARFTREQAAMYQRWPQVIADDPAYNPHLSLAECGYEVETNPVLSPDPLRKLVGHRVLAFASDDQGCGHYRIIQPMQAMLQAGLCSGGTSPEILWPNLALRSGADTLVFQRPIDDRSLDALEALLPLKNIRKVFEVDDNLTRIPLKSIHQGQMPADLRKRINKAIGLCDRLVVSTDALAHELRGLCQDTRVVMNRLPTAMWGEQPPARSAQREPGRRKPRIGWAGGIGHRGDLEMIADVVRELSTEVEWVFFGMCPQTLRPYVHEVHEGIPTLQYPRKLMKLAQDWDLAIAPLELNAFNECKSNLKLLEYGWCGVPVVCSDVTPYQGDWPATRVKNRFKEWRNAILEHIHAPEASRQQGLALQERVASQWLLTGDNLQSWFQAWAA